MSIERRPANASVAVAGTARFGPVRAVSKRWLVESVAALMTCRHGAWSVLAPIWLLPAERPIGRVEFAPTENRRLHGILELRHVQQNVRDYKTTSRRRTKPPTFRSEASLTSSDRAPHHACDYAASKRLVARQRGRNPQGSLTSVVPQLGIRPFRRPARPLQSIAILTPISSNCEGLFRSSFCR